MTHTDFVRTDELPGDAAVGYLDADGPRTNIFHLPVRGNGDGGIYTTVTDMSLFWEALFGGQIVSESWVAEMIRPRSVHPESGNRYGWGFWLHPTGDVVELHGSDAGVSFRSVHDPVTQLSHTVISNVTGGAWEISELLDERLGI